jgi:hypothetical protein
MITRVVANVCGWIGVVLIVGAYVLNVGGQIGSASTLYLVLNAVGSIGIVVNSAIKKDVQPVVLNVIWLIVAVIGLGRAING